MNLKRGARRGAGRFGAIVGEGVTYEMWSVDNLPLGRAASLRLNPDSHWSIWTDDALGWHGDFASDADALAEIQKEFGGKPNAT